MNITCKTAVKKKTLNSKKEIVKPTTPARIAFLYEIFSNIPGVKQKNNGTKEYAITCCRFPPSCSKRIYEL